MTSLYRPWGSRGMNPAEKICCCCHDWLRRLNDILKFWPSIMWHSLKLLWHYQVRPAEIWLFNSVFYANSGIHDLITPVTSRPSIPFVWNSDWIRDNMSWICLLYMIKIPLISYSFLCLKNIGHYFWQGVYKIFSGTTSIRTHTQKKHKLTMTQNTYNHITSKLIHNIFIITILKC